MSAQTSEYPATKPVALPGTSRLRQADGAECGLWLHARWGALMTTDVTGTLDEAYERLHATGPEFDGWLSNHGPMAAEAMVRHGHADSVNRWLDGYMRRLEEFPRGTAAIGEDWRDALGDPRRVADWTAYFRREVTGQPWRRVLGTWWPRLLPGVAAAATHGVIRVGHAARALLADGDDSRSCRRAGPWPGLLGGPLAAGTRRRPQAGASRLQAAGRRPGCGRALGGGGAGGGSADRRPVRRCPRTPRPAGRPAGLAGRPGRARHPRIRRGDRILAGRPGRRRRHQIPVLRARQRHHARALGDRSGRRPAHAARPGHRAVGSPAWPRRGRQPRR